MRNRTGIEDWILEKAKYRREDSGEIFVFPYDLGRWRNIQQVVNFSCSPIGNGITWVIVDGCDQYTLTVGTPIHLIYFYFDQFIYLTFRESKLNKRLKNVHVPELIQFRNVLLVVGFHYGHRVSLFVLVHRVPMNQEFL